MQLPDPVDLDAVLAPCAPRGIDLGLERMKAALAAGGHPEWGFPAVQVAGTNGKGSIATFLHAIFLAAGLRSGVYRSPHLQSWCERIQLGQCWVDGETLRADLERWLPLAQRHALTVFEFFTAAAMDRFARANLDVVVLEVGLGGRLDATTAHPDRRVVGFGPIGLDHQEILGGTLAAVAAEKAGVMASGQLAISAPQSPVVAQVLEHQARLTGCELRWVDPLLGEKDGGPTLGLNGQFQRGNAAVALGMAQSLRKQGWPIAEEALTRGLLLARWPGRLERRTWNGREVLLDGAHNPSGGQALRRELDRIDRRTTGAGLKGRRWLLAIQRTKDGPGLLDALLAPADTAAIVSLPSLPCWSADDLVAARPALKGRLVALATPLEGLTWLTPSDGLPVIAGSLHLLGQIWPLLDPLEPQVSPPLGRSQAEGGTSGCGKD